MAEPQLSQTQGIKSANQIAAEKTHRTGSAALDMLALKRRAQWLRMARPNQLPPQTDWATWMIMTGRGFGKTRSAAEDIWFYMAENPGVYVGVIAPTFDDIRHTCIEGESGFLSCCPEQLIENYNRSLFTIELTNKSIMRGFSSQKPDRLRGPQHHRVWCEELAAWENPTDVWDMMKFGLRLGKNPQKIITTTPRPIKLIRDLVEDPATSFTRGSTYDNKDNLPQKFFDELVQYEDTALGRQELHGEVINLEEMGIFKRSWFKLWPNKRPIPAFEMVVLSIDAAATDKTINDPTAMTAWGLFPISEGSRGFGALLCDAWCEHLQYPDLRTRAIKAYETKYGPGEKRPEIVLIEEKSAGIQLIQDLRRAGIPVRGYNPGRSDKTQRALVTSHLVKDGCIWIPESSQLKRAGEFRDWAEPMIEQCVFFPNVDHDDYVDTLTQFLALMRDTQYMTAATVQDGNESFWRRVQREERSGGNPYS